MDRRNCAAILASMVRSKSCSISGGTLGLPVSPAAPLRDGLDWLATLSQPKLAAGHISVELTTGCRGIYVKRGKMDFC